MKQGVRRVMMVLYALAPFGASVGVPGNMHKMPGANFDTRGADITWKCGLVVTLCIEPVGSSGMRRCGQHHGEKFRFKKRNVA